MTDEDAGALADSLRRARLEAGLSFRELAAKSGVSSSQIRRIEEGENTPTVEALRKLATALELDLTELFESLGIARGRSLPEPRVYFRRKFGVSEHDAEMMARLVEKYQGNGEVEHGEDIQGGSEESDK